jgi:capsular exopolysaccharide synthesis family protein
MSNPISNSAGPPNGNGREFLAELQARALIESEGDSGAESGSVDFLGPMLRRKSIIVLMAMIGAAIGYVLYRRESPTYQSALRLMIWAQPAPSIAMMPGESYQTSVSLPKHQTLISSQLVLSKAVEDGKLGDLETFRGHPHPPGLLKGMISVKPVGNSADTLELTARGGNPDDLPLVLSAVKDAYVGNLNESTLTAGSEIQRLVESLQDRLTTDKQNEEQQFIALVNELRLTSDDLAGQFIHPYLEQQNRLNADRADRARELERAKQLMRGYERVMALPEQERADQIEVLLMKAESFLQIGKGGSSPSDPTGKSENQRLFQAKIDQLDDVIISKQIDLSTLAKSNVGENHPQSLRLRKEIESLQQRQAILRESLVEAGNLDAAEREAAEGNAKGSKLQTGYQRSLLKLYYNMLESDITQYQSMLDSIDQERDTLAAEEAKNREKIDLVNLLRTKIANKQEQVNDIVNRLAGYSVSTTFNPIKVQPIDAPMPGVKVAPILMSYILFGSLIGAMIGTGLALLVDRADMTFRNPYEIFQKMRVPVICKVPNIAKTKIKHSLPCTSTLITAIDPKSFASEAFRVCRTALLFFSNNSEAKTFLVSSPSAGDGKSTTVSNLAVSLAQSGKKVCLLDCDLRRPRQHKHFGVDLKPGLIDVDVDGGEFTLETVIKPTFQENLSIVTSGGHPDNPGEFVVSAKFREILAQLKDRFDIVVIDSPPLLPVADATSLSTQVDGVLLVFRIRKGVVLASTKARELLELVHARILGIIVNGVDQNPYYSEYGGYGYAGYNGYGYGYSYGGDRYYERQVKEYSESSASD